MRLVLAMIALCCLAVVPAVATVQVTVHTARYKVASLNQAVPPTIDWKQDAVFVTTQVKAPIHLFGTRARAAARELAIEKARGEIKDALDNLKLTSYATTADGIRGKILPVDCTRKMLPAMRPVLERWSGAERTMTMVCALPLWGHGTPGEVALRMLENEQQALAATGKPRLHPRAGLKFYDTMPANQLSDGPYTGVILDCRGLNITPILLPKLVDVEGKEIWGTETVNAQMVLHQGTMEYVADLREALANPRAGQMPLLIRPVGVSGQFRGDLVLRPEDAAMLREQDAQSHFLSTLSVVVIFDARSA